MWIFTRYGFYSTVCARKPDGSIDLDTVMVRARAESHLRGLQKRFPALAATQIDFTPEGDYAFRLVASKRDWASTLFELAMEQEWANFRNEVAEHQAGAGRHYLDAIHDVWDRMAHL